MLKSILSFGLVILLNLTVQAQLDSYKYVVVPKKFEGFTYENQFRTSTQIKFLFSQNGYTAIYEDQITPDLAEDPCKGLRVLLFVNSTLLSTRVKLGLQDCNGAIIYESVEGKSKAKDYETAYREAIDEAFMSISELGYSYTPPVAAAGPSSSQPVTATRGEAPTVPSVEGPPPPVASVEQVPGKNVQDIAVEAGAVMAAVGAEEKSGQALWYAQPIEKGYQLVDSTPMVRMKLLETAQEDTFIAIVDDTPMGMVYKKDGQWWHEFFQDGKTEVKPLKIKF
jgi:hypothetical protein